MPKRRRARPRQPGKQRGYIMLVEPIQGASQTVVVEHIRRDPFSQQVLDGFVLKILGHQVQLSEAPPEPIEHHRDRGFPYTHAATAVSRLLIQPLRYSRFLTHSRHNPQMVQSFRLVLHFLRHFLVPPRFFLPYWKSFFPSTLLRNVGYRAWHWFIRTFAEQDPLVETTRHPYHRQGHRFHLRSRLRYR